MIPQRSTNLAQPCLTSEIGRDRVYSEWYDRGMHSQYLANIHIYKQFTISSRKEVAQNYVSACVPMIRGCQTCALGCDASSGALMDVPEPTGRVALYYCARAYIQYWVNIARRPVFLAGPNLGLRGNIEKAPCISLQTALDGTPGRHPDKLHHLVVAAKCIILLNLYMKRHTTIASYPAVVLVTD